MATFRKNYEPKQNPLDLHHPIGDWRLDWLFERQKRGLPHHVSFLRRRVKLVRDRHHFSSVRRRYFARSTPCSVRSAPGENKKVHACRSDVSSHHRRVGAETHKVLGSSSFVNSSFGFPLVNPADLPIWQIDSQIVKTLRSANRLVLVAPTGSGKTTQVPQMLLDAGLAGDKKIVVLQPRRVAARTVAARVAWERGCKLGAEVGYQIRFDDRTSLGTRISYVTEGILLRWLQDDRLLAKVGIILFDEFHERNLLSDAALALVKHLQQSARPDLKMAVMSATLEAEPVAEYLGGISSTPSTTRPTKNDK